MSDTPYTKRVSHTFIIDDEVWEVTDFNTEYIGFEETRKDGQEDSHMMGDARIVDGRWKLDKSTREQIELYAGEETADAIESFFNQHGTPPQARALLTGACPSCAATPVERQKLPCDDPTCPLLSKGASDD